VEETGIQPPSYRTLRRRLPAFAAGSWRAGLAAACARHAGLGPASLVLSDVSTLWVPAVSPCGARNKVRWPLISARSNQSRQDQPAGRHHHIAGIRLALSDHHPLPALRDLPTRPTYALISMQRPTA